jgi:phospholipid/cholesterol/gamma-HCH transport system ATP-binding protein
MSESVIDVRNVSTTLGGHSIHRDLSLSVARGEVVALIGGSGSGKSVLLREIIGLLKPKTGHIELFGQSVWDSTPEQMNALRQRQLARLKLALAGLPPDAARKRPSELSGGMRKRVALARALALDPELLFLDEPTSGLDPISARAFDSLIRLLADSLGLTVFLVTHDLDTLFSIIDRVIVLSDGRVLGSGTLAELKTIDDPWLRDYLAARATDGGSLDGN